VTVLYHHIDSANDSRYQVPKVFGGRFAEHPLEPRPIGTSSPIVATRDGGSVEFEFSDPGYPYGCAVHPEEIGVIWASAGF
jgi:hypothetical protein